MKDFDKERRQRIKEALTDDKSFKLHDETFHIQPDLPIRAIELLESGQANNSLEQVYAAVSLGITEDDRDRFLSLLTTKGEEIGLGEMNDVAEWIVEETTRRPTKRPGSSSSPRATNGTTSKDDSSTSVASGSTGQTPAP